jgi:hypothetical protein
MSANALLNDANVPYNKRSYAGSSWVTNEMQAMALHNYRRRQAEQGLQPPPNFSRSHSQIRDQAVASDWLSAVVAVVMHLFVIGVLAATGLLLVREHHLASALQIAFPLTGLAIVWPLWRVHHR